MAHSKWNHFGYNFIPKTWFCETFFVINTWHIISLKASIVLSSDEILIEIKMVDKIRKIIRVSSVLIFLQICCACKCLLIPWWHVWSSTFLICYFLWKVIWKILNLNRYKPITIIRVYFWGCLCEFVKNFSMQLQQEKASIPVAF